MNNEEVIRILIADDHRMVREGLRAMISTKFGIEVVGEAEDGIEALENIRLLKPDVILLDLAMPRQDGLTTIKKIMAEDSQARILVVTSFGDEERVFSAVKAGALGYLLKDTPPKQLVQAIRDVHLGKPSLHPAIALKVIREMNQPTDLPPTESPLSERELEILKLVAEGLTNQEISLKLTISERTVGKHVSNILTKLHLANRTQAALYALRQGLSNL